MNIAILGYGKEGKSVENYFKKTSTIKIFDNFDNNSLKTLDLSSFDMVFRSPSVPPLDSSWTSVTKYFFDNCICPIIGVTGTKGKGTTCTIITALLKSLGKTVHLVGNIGSPAIDILDQITPEDVVVYEMSSFQLWDLGVSPQISVLLRIEPDHLNIHKDFSDYVSAKSNICRYQSETDSCIYFKNNQTTKEVSEKSPAVKYPYPTEDPSKTQIEILDSLNLPGAHNRENAEAALYTVYALLKSTESFEDFLKTNSETIKQTFKTLKGLPHRMEYLRTFDDIKIYDDNFSTTIPSLDVALKSFPTENIILILGGRDKTNYEDLPEIKSLLDSAKNLQKIILIGESGRELQKKYPDTRYLYAETLEEAVNFSIKSAKSIKTSKNSTVIVMSPAAASFDMFENVYDRGAKFQEIIKNL